MGCGSRRGTAFSRGNGARWFVFHGKSGRASLVTLAEVEGHLVRTRNTGSECPIDPTENVRGHPTDSRTQPPRKPDANRGFQPIARLT
jgi:hypothetical protein